MSWLKNWFTTLFGGIAGVPQIFEGLTTKPINWTLVITGIGTLLLGLTAKDFNTHK